MYSNSIPSVPGWIISHHTKSLIKDKILTISKILRGSALCFNLLERCKQAKRALRALKGLARLQAAISGHDSRKQSAASLHCIQAFVRVQARIHRERAIQSRDALGLPQYKVADPTVETCTADSEVI